MTYQCQLLELDIGMKLMRKFIGHCARMLLFLAGAGLTKDRRT